MVKSTNDALIRRIQTHLTIDLHPSKLASVSTGVHEHLNGLLLKYNENLNGVVLAYSDEKVLSQTALVHPYFPLARLVVAATLVVFRPLPGARLTGIVNKLSDDFIGVVVMGFMNVVIKAPDVRSDLKSPAFGSSAWTSVKNPSHSISVGDSVAFRVVEVKHEGTFVTLTGSLKEKDTGNVAVVGVARAAVAGAGGEEVTKNKEKAGKKNKAGKRKKEEEAEEEEDSGGHGIGGKEVLLKVANGKKEGNRDEWEKTAAADNDKKRRRKDKEKEKDSLTDVADNKVDDGKDKNDIELKGSKAKKKEKNEKKRKKGGGGDGD